MSTRKVPERLYQYQPCTERAVANVIISNIYCAAPTSFNDPYDCRFSIAEQSPQQIQALRDKLRAEGELNIPDSDEEFVQSQHEQAQRKIQEMGVCCLSENAPKDTDSFLMWAHYAKQHNGFCLEFDTSEHPFCTARDVDYVEEHPCVDIINAEIHETLTDEDMTRSLNTKSEHWDYENEWRIISPCPYFVRYRPRQLKAIYYGIKMTNASKLALSLTLKSREIDLYEMVQIKGSYKLDTNRLEIPDYC